MKEPTRKTAAVPVTWAPLSTEATDSIYPSFAWVVPDSAAVGEVFYVQVNVSKGSSILKRDYFGVFEVTVVADAELVEVAVKKEEASTLLATILIVLGVVAATVAIFYYFVV